MYVPRQKHLDIDGAYFGISFANILFKTYPDLYPKDGPLTYQPLIFGFKIFGQKGSAYEEKFDNSGKAVNKSAKEVLQELKIQTSSGKTVPLFQQHFGLTPQPEQSNVTMGSSVSGGAASQYQPQNWNHEKFSQKSYVTFFLII